VFTKVRVAMNKDCQLKCIYCPHNKNILMENYDNEDNYRLKDAEFLGIIKVMVDCGVTNVHFTGGEPTIKSNIAQIVKTVKSFGAAVELNTNGIGLTQGLTRELKGAGIEFLKISLDTPYSQDFFHITGGDCFDSVIIGIKNALQVMPVRLNCVVMRANQESIIDLLRISNDLGVQQIHLLDLTYYPSCADQKEFWEKEFVYLTKEVLPEIENEFNCIFKVTDIFGCRFYQAQLSPGGITAVLKEAQPTMRSPLCTSCPEYCHEGIFTLRLSCNGYLNFCPAKNSLGINALKAWQEGNLTDALRRYSEIFDSAIETNSFEKFLNVNQLNFRQ